MLLLSFLWWFFFLCFQQREISFAFILKEMGVFVVQFEPLTWSGTAKSRYCNGRGLFAGSECTSNRCGFVSESSPFLLSVNFSGDYVSVKINIGISINRF